jgi:hypothetical protein
LSYRPHARLARAVLIWTLACWVGVQLLLARLIEWGPIWRRDPELARKHEALASLERRGAALVLVMGSSRILQGLDARRLSESNRLRLAGRPVCVFNLGLTAAGPLRHWQVLRFLDDRGVVPEVLILEILPMTFNEPGPGRFSEQNWLVHTRHSWQDVARLSRYHTQPLVLWRDWLHCRAFPAARYRATLRATGPAPHQMDSHGWEPYPFGEPDATTRALLTEHSLAQFGPVYRDFRLWDAAVRVCFDLLAHCQRRGVALVPLLTPEGSAFRPLRSQRVDPALHSFLRDYQRHGAQAVIDATDWLDDSEFWDGHHPSPRGAARLTARLGDELARRFDGDQP